MDVVHLPPESDADSLARVVGGAGTAVTIGAYDGVHLGHRELIARVRAEAATLGCLSAVVTFDRHPATVVRPESAPKLLTDPGQKLELLASTGVDLTVVVHFDEQRAEEDAQDFVRSVLVDQLKVGSVVVGHDFHFGQARRGNVELLQRMGADLGFDVTGVRLRREGGEPVSSTRIRAYVAAGEVEQAAALLGRWHQVRGLVEQGDKRGGALLGYPTANLAVPAAIAIPADGVYAGWYLGPDAERRPACISVGRRPTFYEQADRSLVEAHLMDFDGDLYGQPAGVELVARQRGQERFERVEDLIEQIGLDVATARELLAGAGGPAADS